MINMLIAMMTKSYEDIIHHSDIEWKFAKSKLYIQYIKEGFTLPVPLNLIPTPNAVYHFVKFIYDKLSNNQKQLRQTNSNSISHSAEELGSNFERKSQVSPTNSNNSTIKNNNNNLTGSSNSLKITTGSVKIKRQESERTQTHKTNDEDQNLTYRVRVVAVLFCLVLHCISKNSLLFIYLSVEFQTFQANLTNQN